MAGGAGHRLTFSSRGVLWKGCRVEKAGGVRDSGERSKGRDVDPGLEPGARRLGGNVRARRDGDHRWGCGLQDGEGPGDDRAASARRPHPEPRERGLREDAGTSRDEGSVHHTQPVPRPT